MQQRRHLALDMAQPDQVVAERVIVVEQRKVAPAEEVAQIARRLVVEGIVSPITSFHKF